MKLIIILACLTLERYVRIGHMLQRFQWFDQYLTVLSDFCREKSIWGGWLGLSIIVLPIILLTGIAYWSVAGWLFGLVGVLLSFAILLYSFGPDDFVYTVDRYLLARQTDEPDVQKAMVANVAHEAVPDEAPLQQRFMTTAMLVQGNQHFIAVIFWFVLLGPLAALFYRLLAIIRQRATSADSVCAAMASEVNLLFLIVDAIPARLSGLLYALVGNFAPAFAVWSKASLRLKMNTQTLLSDTGLAALGVKEGDNPAPEEQHNALLMIQNAIWVALALIAVFTIGTWIP